VIGRIIGEGQIGTQGTPVELLAQLIPQKLYPELWQARNELTTIANSEIADAGSSPMPGHGA
jgi:tryptophan 2,3-dioxygenase